MSNFGIILAAGLGTRMGTPKAFLALEGKPILLYSLLTFQRSSLIDGIGVVCRKEDIQAARQLAKDNPIEKLCFVVPGGKERQDSVACGIQALPKKTTFVAVHDAARPLAAVELLNAVLETAQEKEAAIAATPVKDTVKVTKDGQAIETLNRDTLWLAQTPQAFQLELFKKALTYAQEKNFYGTDCASLIEHYGKKVWLVQGPPENIKITTATDLLFAEAILKNKMSFPRRT